MNAHCLVTVHNEWTGVPLLCAIIIVVRYCFAFLSHRNIVWLCFSQVMRRRVDFELLSSAINNHYRSTNSCSVIVVHFLLLYLLYPCGVKGHCSQARSGRIDINSCSVSWVRVVMEDDRKPRGRANRCVGIRSDTLTGTASMHVSVRASLLVCWVSMTTSTSLPSMSS